MLTPQRLSFRILAALHLVFFSLVLRTFIDRERPDEVAVPSIFATLTALTFCEEIMVTIFCALLRELATTADLLAETRSSSFTSSTRLRG